VIESYATCAMIAKRLTGKSQNPAGRNQSRYETRDLQVRRHHDSSATSTTTSRSSIAVIPSQSTKHATGYWTASVSSVSEISDALRAGCCAR